MMNDAYFRAVRESIMRTHSKRWSLLWFRRVCKCGANWPCPVREVALRAAGDRKPGQ